MWRFVPVLVLALAPAAHAGTFEATPADDLEAKINALVAGDELIVHFGVVNPEQVTRHLHDRSISHF